MPDNGIDFIVTWVDDRDPEWRARRAALTGSPSADTRDERYRDWDLLPFWFRGVERFAPWVRRVWFVCDQTPPAWLNPACPKLRITRHEDFIPAEYRPAFSSNPIELNFHRIPGLSERFVFFNDDMYLLRPVSEDFFFRNGLPRDAALLNPVPTTDLRGAGPDARIFTIPLNDAEYLNRDFDFRACVRQHLFKWLAPVYGSGLIRNLLLMAWPRFVGFDEPHLPQAFLKASYEAAWAQDGDVLAETSSHPLRDDRDVNQWLIRQRQLAEGRFIPRRPIRDAVFRLGDQAEAVCDAVRHQRKPMICVNDDSVNPADAPRIREAVQNAFEAILPERSGFERGGA